MNTVILVLISIFATICFFRIILSHLFCNTISTNEGMSLRDVVYLNQERAVRLKCLDILRVLIFAFVMFFKNAELWHFAMAFVLIFTINIIAWVLSWVIILVEILRK